MLTLTHKKDTYTIKSHYESTWKTVYRNGEHIGLVMDECSAMQVIYTDISKTDTINYLTLKDFEEI